MQLCRARYVSPHTKPNPRSHAPWLMVGDSAGMSSIVCGGKLPAAFGAAASGSAGAALSAAGAAELDSVSVE